MTRATGLSQMRRSLTIAAVCLLAASGFAWLALRGGDAPWPEAERMMVVTGWSIGSPPIHHEVTRYMLYYQFQASDSRRYDGASIAREPVQRGMPVIVLYDAADPERRSWASPSDSSAARSEYAAWRETQIDEARKGRIAFAAAAALLLAIGGHFAVSALRAVKAAHKS